MINPEKAEQLAQVMRCDECPALDFCKQCSSSLCADVLATWLEEEDEQ